MPRVRAFVWCLALLLLSVCLPVRASAATKRSFVYVATPAFPCQETGCSAEVLVYDANTLGLVTHIPLPQVKSAIAEQIAPDGKTLYVVSPEGVSIVDLTVHSVVGTFLKPIGTGGRYGETALSADGSRLYIVDQTYGSQPIEVFDTLSHTYRYVALSFVSAFSIATNPVNGHIYIWGSFVCCSAIPGDAGAGLYELDAAEQPLRTNSSVPLPKWGMPTGNIAVASDGSRIYVPVAPDGTHGLMVLDTSSLNAIGTVSEAPTRVVAGMGGARVYTLVGSLMPSITTPTPSRARVYDALNLTAPPLVEIPLQNANNVIPSEDESRLFVTTSTRISDQSFAGNIDLTYRNRLPVFETSTGQPVATVALPDSRYIQGTFRAGTIAPANGVVPLAATPLNAARCSYDLGTTQQMWPVDGGTAAILLTTSCSWVASSDASWLHLSATSGSAGQTIAINVDRANTGAARQATLTIAGQSITIAQAGYAYSPPFGFLDTPADGATGISGSLLVTGWALDDAGVTAVRIFRDPVSGETPGVPVFIGNATFVEGARPDVQMAYSSLPFSSRAGWGLNLLTNMLPGGGNGTYRLYAYIDDVEGHTTVLGPRTFTAANRVATLPFGTIDTPGQGETVSGATVVFGWALAPQPNVIPVDGSTIDVVVDGVAVGHPVYNNFRADIASLFPGYANTNGAVGYFVLDTTPYANGLHTLSWIVRDSAGNAAGIGSRYINVQNP